MAAPNTFNRGIPRQRKIRSQLQAHGSVSQQYKPAGPSVPSNQVVGKPKLSTQQIARLTGDLQSTRADIKSSKNPKDAPQALTNRINRIRGMLAGRRSGAKPIGKPQPPTGTPLGPKPPLGPPGPFPGSFGPRTGPPTGGGIGDPGPGGPYPVPRRRRIIGGGRGRTPGGRPIGY